MSSEQLADGVNPLDAELAATWDVLKGYSGRDTDLGIARRFGGSAAAYSLRDIGAMNGPVVKVRREPHDTTASIDDEQDFSASQVASGALEDWVNGKFESTLPADVDTAAAAYSLRKVKASYAEDAVRIRRTSDDIEVEVAFDSEGKVSASSPITDGGTELTPDPDADLGSTTATTLGEFLTEDVNIFTDSSSQSWANIRSTDSFETSTALGGEVNYRKFTPNSGVGTSTLLGISSFFDVSASSTYTISGQVYVPSGQTTVNAFKIVNGTSGSSPSLSGATNTVPATDQWVDFSFTSAIPTATQLYINAAKDQNAFFSPNGSDFIAFKDITVTATDSGATVHTWYDQAGSNDAVQATAANQPKISENGALLANGLLFDGTNSFMQTTAGFALTASDDLSFSVVLQSSNLSATQNVISQENGTGTGRSWLILSSDDLQTFLGGSAALFGTFTTNKFLYTSIYDDSDATIDGFKDSATSGSQLTSKSVEAASGALNIGESKAGTNRLDGSIEEIIIYKSDQTDNRFKIESNINNYYGLYTFQGDGFVQTWYDQSGNGRHATQDTVDRQPKIVVNGSITTLDNGTPSLSFIRQGSRFERLNFDTHDGNNIVEPVHVVLTANSKRTAFTYIVSDVTSGGSGSGPLVFLNATSFRYLTNGTDLIETVDGDADAIYSMFSAENGGTGVARRNGTQIGTVSRDAAESDGFAGIMYNPGDDANNVFLESLVIYSEDKSAEIQTIENELAQPIELI